MCVRVFCPNLISGFEGKMEGKIERGENNYSDISKKVSQVGWKMYKIIDDSLFSSQCRLIIFDCIR